MDAGCALAEAVARSRVQQVSGGDRFGAQSRHEVGDAFERWLDEQHEKAGQRGALAHVVHNQAVSKVIHGRLMFEKPGVADYSGVLHGGGALAVEAKSVAPDGRLPKSRIEQKQIEHLDAVMTAGGNSLALLLVEFRVHSSTAHRRYAIPWHEVPWKVLKTAESLDERDIAVSYQIAPGTDYLEKHHRGSERRYSVGTHRKRVYPVE